MVFKLEITLIWILSILSKRFRAKEEKIQESKHTGEKEEVKMDSSCS